MTVNNDKYCPKSLTEISLRRKLNDIVTGPLIKGTPFIPRNAARNVALWFFSMHMTEEEKRVASQMTKDILIEYERRLRWLGEELEQEVFKRFGG